jgi:hypothetical protein
MTAGELYEVLDEHNGALHPVLSFPLVTVGTCTETILGLRNPADGSLDDRGFLVVRLMAQSPIEVSM